MDLVPVWFVGRYLYRKEAVSPIYPASLWFCRDSVDFLLLNPPPKNETPAHDVWHGLQSCQGSQRRGWAAGQGPESTRLHPVRARQRAAVYVSRGVKLLGRSKVFFFPSKPRPFFLHLPSFPCAAEPLLFICSRQHALATPSHAEKHPGTP